MGVTVSVGVQCTHVCYNLHEYRGGWELLLVLVYSVPVCVTGVQRWMGVTISAGVQCTCVCYRSIQVDGKTIKAQIWDTAGQERYRAITSA